MRKMMKTAILLALVAVMLCSSAMAAVVGAKVLATNMTVYTSSGAAGTLPQGTTIAVTDMAGDWLKIYYGGYTGYCQIKDVAFTSGIKAVTNTNTPIAFVTKASYSQYTYYTATLTAGYGVYVVGKRGNYALVTNGNGSALGYVPIAALTKV